MYFLGGMPDVQWSMAPAAQQAVCRALRKAFRLALHPKRHSVPGLQQPLAAKYCPLSEV